MKQVRIPANQMLMALAFEPYFGTKIPSGQRDNSELHRPMQHLSFRNFTNVC